MSVLRNIERGIEGLFERGFRRAFRSSLQPVELARKLAREMDDHKTVSVSRVYGPNEFHVFLAPADREQFESYEGALATELETYLEAHAGSAGLSLVARPVVTFETDADLRPGEFGISCRMAEDVPEAEVEVDEPAPPPAPAPAPAVAPARPAPPPHPPRPAAPNRGLAGVSGTQVLSPAQARPPGGSLSLVVNGSTQRVRPGVSVIGRSRDCDIVIADPNVSRRHAEIRLVGQDWIVSDLGSTNGVEVDGRRVGRHVLRDGDELMLGTARIRVEVG